MADESLRRTPIQPKAMPTIKLDLNDGGLLYQDERFGNEYEELMKKLTNVYQAMVQNSAAGDMELKTDSPEVEDREELLGQLKRLYSELRIPEQTVDTMVGDAEAKLMGAARAIKPAYDRWEENQHGWEPEL